MRTDLGTWRGPQAQAVVRVLRDAGLSPQTERAADGTRITVPEEQNDAAHQVLVASMDRIARAANGDQPSSTRRRRRASEATPRTTDEEGPALVTERLRNFAPLVGLVVALVVAAMIPPGGLRTSVFVFVLVGFGIAWARRNDDGSGS